MERETCLIYHLPNFAHQLCGNGKNTSVRLYTLLAIQHIFVVARHQAKSGLHLNTEHAKVKGRNGAP